MWGDRFVCLHIYKYAFVYLQIKGRKLTFTEEGILARHTGWTGIPSSHPALAGTHCY